MSTWSMQMKVEGLDALDGMISRIERQLAPDVLAYRATQIAREAGVTLLRAAVQACVEAVYQNPTTPGPVTDGSFFTNVDGERVFMEGVVGHGGYPADRSGDLVDAHELVSGGLLQTVRINPDYPVSGEAHPGRELVLDYAYAVHEGYVQWVGGQNTGVFHPGRFWMEIAAIESFDVIIEFVAIAFTETVEKAIAA